MDMSSWESNGGNRIGRRPSRAFFGSLVRQCDQWKKISVKHQELEPFSPRRNSPDEGKKSVFYPPGGPHHGGLWEGLSERCIRGHLSFLISHTRKLSTKNYSLFTANAAEEISETLLWFDKMD